MDDCELKDFLSHHGDLEVDEIGTDDLYHHGVKGMKWGVRRTPAQLGHFYKKLSKKIKKANDARKASNAIKKAAKEEEKHRETLAKKKIHDLSDAELEQRIKRLKKEQEASNLEAQILKNKPDERSAAQRFISKVGKDILVPALVDVGKQQLKNYLNKVVGEKMSDVLAKRLDKSKDKPEDKTDSKPDDSKKSTKHKHLKRRRARHELTLDELFGSPDPYKPKHKKKRRKRLGVDDIADIDLD